VVAAQSRTVLPIGWTAWRSKVDKQRQVIAALMKR
jgi:hypothetical protein